MECDEVENGLRMVDLQVGRVVEPGLYDEISFPHGGTTCLLMVVEEKQCWKLREQGQSYDLVPPSKAAVTFACHVAGQRRDGNGDGPSR